MDIQISSNFERLLFDASWRDPAEVRIMMANLRQSGWYDLKEKTLGAIRSAFEAASATEAEILETMKTMHNTSGTLLEPTLTSLPV